MALDYPALIEALEKALASGTREVEYLDKRLKYTSVNEMLKALEYLKKKVAGTQNAPLLGASVIYDKGLC